MPQLTQEQLAAFIDNPPGGRFLTPLHVTFPSTIDPTRTSTIFGDLLTYAMRLGAGFGLGYLGGYIFKKDEMRWGKIGAGVNVGLLWATNTILFWSADQLRERGRLQQAVEQLPNGWTANYTGF